MTKLLKILCRAQNVVYNVVSISGCELVGLEHKWAGFATLIKGAKSPSKINPISLRVIETISCCASTILRKARRLWYIALSTLSS